MLTAGTTIGRYVIENHLGEGGMASVYRARLLGPQGFDKEVAVKVLKPQDDEDWQSDLAKEARVSARLRHRNIVDIYEFAEVDDTVLIAMELVEGLSLGKALAIGGLPPPSLVAEIGMQACAGLSAAHSARENGKPMAIVHRDIKPSNLMLSIDGAVKVVDFGIATLAGGNPDAFGDDTITGTITYMSPEQFLSHSVDAQSDIFSMGLVLFAMVRGEPLFTQTHNAFSLGDRLDEYIRDRIDDLHADDRIPGLLPTLRKSLSVIPEHRHASIEDIEDELDDLIQTLPRGPRLRRWVRNLIRGNEPQATPYKADLPTSKIDALLDAPTAPEPKTLASNIEQAELPQERTDFVGNEQLVNGLATVLQQSAGCWFLYGPQGVGKSRTALHLLHQFQTKGWNDLFWISAEHIKTVNDLVCLVAARLGVDLSQCTTEAERSEAVTRALTHRENSVVVVDDITRIADAAASTLSDWTARTRGTRLIATCVHRVESAAIELVPVTPLSETDAVALLSHHCDSSQNHDPMLLRRVVNSVDRLPLAIELAAAQIETVGLAQVANGVMGVAAQEGEALYDMLGWSWSTLNPWEQQALLQCSVFQTPFSLMAAETVVHLPSGAPWVHDVLQRLHQASWLSIEKTVYGERYRVFASVRTFLSQQREPPVNSDAVKLRHALWMAERADPETLRRIVDRTGQTRHNQIRGMGLDFHNAIEYAIQRGEGALATRLAPPIEQLMESTGSYNALVDIFERALAIPALDPEDKGLLLSIIGEIRPKIGDKETGLNELRESLTLLDPVDPELAASCRIRLAYALGTVGQFEEAESIGLTALEQITANGWTEMEPTINDFMARLCMFTRRPEQTLKYARTAKQTWTPNSTVLEAQVDYSLGEAECNMLNFDAGYRWLRRALEKASPMGSQTTGYMLALCQPMVQLFRTKEAVSFMELAHARAQRSGQVVHQIYALSYMAGARVTLTGDLNADLPLLDEASERAEQLGIGYLQTIVEHVKNSVLLDRAINAKDVETAGPLLEKNPIPEEGAYGIRREAALLNHAHYYLIKGDTETAHTHTSMARKRINESHSFECAVRLQLLEAWIELNNGHTGAAQRKYHNANSNSGYSPGNVYSLDRLFDTVRNQIWGSQGHLT